MTCGWCAVASNSPDRPRPAWRMRAGEEDFIVDLIARLLGYGCAVTLAAGILTVVAVVFFVVCVLFQALGD